MFLFLCNAIWKRLYNLVIPRAGASIRKGNKHNSKQHKTCHRTAGDSIIYKWKCKGNNCVLHRYCILNFCSKSYTEYIKLLLWEQEKHKSSTLVCIWELVQWYRKLTCYNYCNYCCYGYHCFRLHTQEDNIPWKKGRKNEKRKIKKEKNQPNQQSPLLLPKAISYLFAYGKSCSWTECSANPVPAESLPSLHSIATLFTYWHCKGFGKCLIRCRWTRPTHAYCVQTAGLFRLPPSSEVRCVAWLQETLGCAVLSEAEMEVCVGVGCFFKAA